MCGGEGMGGEGRGHIFAIYLRKKIILSEITGPISL